MNFTLSVCLIKTGLTSRYTFPFQGLGTVLPYDSSLRLPPLAVNYYLPHPRFLGSLHFQSYITIFRGNSFIIAFVQFELSSLYIINLYYTMLYSLFIS